VLIEFKEKVKKYNLDENMKFQGLHFGGGTLNKKVCLKCNKIIDNIKKVQEFWGNRIKEKEERQAKAKLIMDRKESE
jgi:hypothetical protein